MLKLKNVARWITKYTHMFVYRLIQNIRIQIGWPKKKDERDEIQIIQITFKW